MPCQLLPLCSLDSPGVLRFHLGASILRRAFPFKLKYLPFQAKPARILLHSSESVGIARRNSIRLDNSGSRSKQKAVGKGETQLGDWQFEEMERDGKRSSRGKNKVALRDGKINPKASVYDTIFSKRSDDSSKSLQVIDKGRGKRTLDESGGRASKIFPSKKRVLTQLGKEDEGEDWNSDSHPKFTARSSSVDVTKKKSGNAVSAVSPIISASEDESYLSETR